MQLWNFSGMQSSTGTVYSKGKHAGLNWIDIDDFLIKPWQFVFNARVF